MKLLKKLLYSLTTILLAITLIFFVIRLSPGDPVESILGQKATEVEMQKVREQLGLHLPMMEQYKIYLTGIVKGDLGMALFGKKSVVELLKERMKPTIVLAIFSVSLSAVLGMYLGIMAGYHKSKFFDSMGRIISLVALSFPIFSLAPILVIFFSLWLNWLPVSEWTSLRHGILPILTLVIPLSAVIMRVTRNKFLEEYNAQWVTVLRAKGLSEQQILLRILKICFPTILNVVAIQLSVVITGTMITETIFDIPGMGSLLFEGIQNRDYPVVQGIIVYSTFMYMTIYFFIEYINEIIDPRMGIRE